MKTKMMPDNKRWVSIENNLLQFGSLLNKT